MGCDGDMDHVWMSKNQFFGERLIGDFARLSSSSAELPAAVLLTVKVRLFGSTGWAPAGLRREKAEETQ